MEGDRVGRGIGGYWGKWNVLDLGCKGLVVEMVGGGIVFF